MIADQILQSYVDGFSKDHELEGLKPEELFEFFANSTVVSKILGQTVDPLDVSTGTAAFGIDGISILVNDQLVLSADEVQERSRTRLDAHFIFIQAKSKPAFDAGDILKFTEGVRAFFDKKPLPGETDEVARCRKAKDAVYANSIKMEVAPLCELFFVACGRWKDDPLLLRTIDQSKEALKGTGLFSDVKWTSVDVEKLKSYYRALKQQVVKQINFEKFAVLPRMADVDQAYIGVLPAKEYLKLIVDEDGNLERNLFYDNVRDFQGDNPVNTEISESLRAAVARQDKFAILNNGITIVAREIRPIGTEFTVRDYQVVNGCQTSHVLFFNKTFVTDHLFVPIKLIATSSQDVANLVIKATNRQTEVREEAFAALEPFHKKLEEFYASITEISNRLYYERRSQQYARENIAPTRIVSITVQTKAFVCMFTSEPHNAHHYYGELLKTYWQAKKQMYVEEHDPAPYFAAALSFVEADRVLKAPARTKYRPYRYHLLALLGMRFFGNDPMTIFAQSPKRILSSCKELIAFWQNPNTFLPVLSDLCEFIESLYAKAGSGADKWELIKRKDFTEEVKKAYRNRYGLTGTKKPVEPVVSLAPKIVKPSYRRKGVIKRIGAEFGFISDSQGQDIFFHRSSVTDGSSYKLVPGSSVEFTPVLAPRGLKAVEIILAPS